MGYEKSHSADAVYKSLEGEGGYLDDVQLTPCFRNYPTHNCDCSIDHLLVKFVVDTNLPLYLVEKFSFRNIINLFCHVHSAKHFSTNLLVKEYNPTR